MSDWTVRNLRDVEDMAPRFGMTGVEARFARLPLECEHVGLSLQRLGPGVRMPFGHRHGEQEEVYVVLAGSGRVRLDDEYADVAPWDAVRVSRSTMRAFEAGPDGLEFLAFGAPAGNEDAEMDPGWWPADT
jgi:mannose-6-phosphate isomerase-like protein (cupin superfamily)